MSTVGAFGIGPSVLLFLVNAARSLRSGAPAPADPWDGRTLEWRTSSPPPVHDFDTIPPVYGRDTYWREEKRRPRGGAPPPEPGGGGPRFLPPAPAPTPGASAPWVGG